MQDHEESAYNMFTFGIGRIMFAATQQIQTLTVQANRHGFARGICHAHDESPLVAFPGNVRNMPGGIELETSEHHLLGDISINTVWG